MLAQQAALKALMDGDYIRKTRQYISTERKFLRNALNEISGLNALKSAANFLLVSVDSRAGINSTELKGRLAREGMLIRDCNTFQGMGDRYFRVAVKKHKQNMILIEKLKEIRK